MLFADTGITQFTNVIHLQTFHVIKFLSLIKSRVPINYILQIGQFSTIITKRKEFKQNFANNARWMIWIEILKKRRKESTTNLSFCYK